MSFFSFIYWGRKKAVSPLEKNKNPSPNEILIIPGSVEVTLLKNDIVALNLDSPINIKRNLQEIIDQINAKNGLSILAHPTYLIKPYPCNKLRRLNNFLGIEIYNPGKIPWPESTHIWDFLLSYKYGEKIWGFASDDMHDLKRDAGRAWIVVMAKDKKIPDILEALKKGSFYSSTGPSIEEIFSDSNHIGIRINKPSKILFIGFRHKILKVSFGKETVYSLRPEDKYIRIEIRDFESKKKAWTQPIFVQGGKIIYSPYSEKRKWLKGCIHIHTDLNGGKNNLNEVIEWYKRYGYDFLAITEHNFITHPKNLVNI